jgi:hypothetical protein
MVNLVRFQPPRLRLDSKLGVRGAIRGLWWLYSLNRVIWQKSYKTNAKEHCHFIGADHIFGSIIKIWKNMAICISGAMVNQFHSSLITLI